MNTRLLAPDDRIVDIIERARAEAVMLEQMFGSAGLSGRFHMFADTLEELMADRNVYRDRCASVVKTNDELARQLEFIRAGKRKRSRA